MYHATVQDTFSSIGTDVNAVSLQSCAHGAWTRVAYTYADPGSAYLGIQVLFDLGNNFSTNGKYCIVTATDIRATPGIAAGLNGSPPAPELRPVGADMPLCERYYRASTENFQWCGNTTSGSQYYVSVRLGITMRASPTISTTQIAASGFASTPTVNNVGTTGFSNSYAANATASGSFYTFSWTASAEL